MYREIYDNKFEKWVIYSPSHKPLWAFESEPEAQDVVWQLNMLYETRTRLEGQRQHMNAIRASLEGQRQHMNGIRASLERQRKQTGY